MTYRITEELDILFKKWQHLNKEVLKKFDNKSLLFYLCIALVSSSIGYASAHKQESVNEELQAMIGESAVMALYNFRTLEQLSIQMSELASLTTDAVYNQLTIDNEERALNTYLKFKNEPTFVTIHKSTSHYVIYSLDNKYIDSSRRFIFLFSLDSHNKISEVREVEGLDFIEISD